MKITLRILMGLGALICFVGSMNLLIKGAHGYLPDTVPPQLRLDNILRFVSGIYFALGFLITWATINVNKTGNLTYFVGLLVIFAGLGRLWSRIDLGSAGAYFDSMMYLEFVLGLAIMILKYFSAKKIDTLKAQAKKL